MIFGFAVLVPALVLLTVAPGCSKKKDGGGDGAGEVKKAGDAKKAGGNGGGEKTALDAKLDGVITGTVTYDGDPPALMQVAGMAKHQDGAKCLMGTEEEKSVQTWIVNSKNKGVANVVVWLKAPAGKYFPVSDEDKKRTKPVTITQPHCAFQPHVSALYPSYFDGKKQMKTGQILEIVNNATFPHNTKLVVDPAENDAFNETIPPKEKRTVTLKYQKKPIEVGCTFHTWMSGYVWTFDHPYFAVTDHDGKFTIKNAPTGAEVSLVAWHESQGEFDSKKQTFKKGENTADLKVSKKE
jgi:hypothetical protein